MALCRVGMRKGRFGFGDETAMGWRLILFFFNHNDGSDLFLLSLFVNPNME